MNKIIRSKVWETNSSSCHSVSVFSGSTDYDTIEPDDCKVIKIQLSIAGYETDFNTPSLKLAYLYLYVEQAYDEYSKDFEEKRKIINLIEKVVLDHTGAKYLIFDKDKDFIYIDDLGEYEFDKEKELLNPEFLKNFIFNKKSFVEVEDRDEKYRRENGYDY